MNTALLSTLGLIFLCSVALTWITLRAAADLFARYRETFTAQASINLREMFLFIDPRRLFQANLVLFVLVPAGVYLVTGAVLFALIAAGVLAVLPRYAYVWLKRRRIKAFEQQMPDALMAIAGAMRAGASLPLAIESMVREQQPPISQEFALVLREHRLGVSLDEAFEHLGDRVPSQELVLVLSAMRIAREVGGNLAETLDRLADTLRKKFAMEGKIAALTAQGKLQGWVVGLLPFAMAAVLYKMEPQAIYPLFHSILGWIVVGVILLMEFLGVMMIRKIVSIDV